MIPKYIFQTHEKKYSELPMFMRELSNTWIDLNPSYDYVYMDSIERREYIKKNYPLLLDLYDVASGIYQADLWRYCIVHDNGGVYADFDSVCIKSLDTITVLMTEEHEMICTPIRPETYINNANFASIKYSNLLKKIINNIYEFKKIPKKNFDNDWFARLGWSTSFSDVIMKNLNNVLLVMDDVSFHSEEFKTDKIDHKKFIEGYLTELKKNKNNY